MHGHFEDCSLSTSAVQQYCVVLTDAYNYFDHIYISEARLHNRNSPLTFSLSLIK